MRDSLFSPWWHRVRDIRPRLRADVRVQRQRYREETWYLLVDETSGRQHRINAAAFELIGRFDGRATLNELWTLLLGRLGDQAPGQEEVVQTLSRLAAAELVQLDGAPDIGGLFARREQRRVRRRPWVNPLAFSTRLLDPSGLLRRLAPVGAILFHPGALAACAMLVIAALLAALVNWDSLRAHAASHLSSERYLLLAWLAYPAVKAIHELAHGLAVRRWGGEVHELGVTFFVFTPAPYVDASAANAFRDRAHRAMVSGAGILAEGVIGAAALFAWLALEPGLLNDIAFVVLLICAASSVLFNANPLLRFDGYHLMCDLLETPNLAARSQAYWLHLVRRALGGDAATAQAVAPGELKWLLAYAPASWVYRLVLSIALVLWVGAKSALLGWVIGALLAVFVVVLPAKAAGQALWRSFAPGGARRRAGAFAGAATAALVAVLLAWPVPNRVAALGVVWPPEPATVRAETDGFVTDVLVRDGETVTAGAPLVRLAEPALLAERDALRARLQGLAARQYDAILRDAAQLRNILEDIEQARGELARVESRIEQWTIRAKTAGQVAIPGAHDLPGSFLQQGTVVAYVLGPTAPLVRAAVPQEHAMALQDGVRGVDVWLAGAAAPLEARPAGTVSAATRVLPSAALADAAGGSVLVDPGDKRGTLALEPFVLFDVVALGAPLERLGARAWVRFDLGTEPLAFQWLREARRALLRHFNPRT